jgi:hypothetical protein
MVGSSHPRGLVSRSPPTSPSPKEIEVAALTIESSQAIQEVFRARGMTYATSVVTMRKVLLILVVPGLNRAALVVLWWA